jgi:hypothetical protein
MASIKQVEANRHNSQKSTGPRTPEGKAAVRLNALRHGLCARTAVLPTENAEEFHQLCADLETEWQAQGRTEQYLLEQMAVSQWKRPAPPEWSFSSTTTATSAKPGRACSNTF